MYKEFVEFVRRLYGTEDFIPLHEPRFRGNEKKYLNDCIDSTYVSSVGKYVNQFEEKVAELTGVEYAVAAVNGTAALHIALLLADVQFGDEVITQPLTFIATANAIAYLNAKPVFIDIDKDTLGLSAEKLTDFLVNNTRLKPDGYCYNKISGKRIKACVPMHTFGHPCRIDKIKGICADFNISMIEDAAESLGSYFKRRHTGSFGLLGILSFNGNKTITSGGGGMIVTNNEELAKKAKHLTTQAKVPHKWEYNHDMVGYNYRLTNLAAALGLAQLEQLPGFLKEKRVIAKKYASFFNNSNINFVSEPDDCKSNYWLNTVLLENRKERDGFLEYTNANSIMTRPAWELMNRLEMFKHCQRGNLENAEWLAERLVNIPSSVI